MSEKIVDVTGTVEDTDHFDTSLGLQEEAEGGVVQNAAPRMID